MIIQQPLPAASPNPLNIATRGVVGALRKVTPDSASSSNRLSDDMRLPDSLLALLRPAFDKAGGSLEEIAFESPDQLWRPFKGTLAKSPRGDFVLLDIAGAILGDGQALQMLVQLQRALRGRTVRLVSHDLIGDPASTINTLKRDWLDDDRVDRRIDLDFIPLSRISNELQQDPARLWSVLNILPGGGAGQPDPTQSTPNPASAAPSRAAAAPSAPAPAIRTTKIFIASSAELRADRDEFDLYCRQLNDHFMLRGHYLQIVRWENFLDAMSESRLQDEYNQAVRDCDLFVCLFFTKTGAYTREEFQTAYDGFRSAARRPRIYTYFKDGQLRLSTLREVDLQSLWRFKEALGELGHFPTGYNDTSDLKLHFRAQLDRLLP